MNIRTFAWAALAVFFAGSAADATERGFSSVAGPSSAPGAAAAASPAGTTMMPTPAPPAFGSVSSMAPAGAPAPAVPTSVTSLPATASLPAFSSVSSVDASGSGPVLPVAADGNVLADRILIEKGARRLTLLSRGAVIAEYPVKLGLSPRGHKQFEGDFRTPEGVYHLSRRNPRSEFFLSVEVSYPNAADRARAKEEGVRPGGAIMIHGQPNVPRKPPEYYANRDWTDGCIAVSNAAMVDIWQRTRIGIPIEIRP
jgi:hypothetical protein